MMKRESVVDDENNQYLIPKSPGHTKKQKCLWVCYFMIFAGAFGGLGFYARYLVDALDGSSDMS
jgi:hypothetical protein